MKEKIKIIVSLFLSYLITFLIVNFSQIKDFLAKKYQQQKIFYNIFFSQKSSPDNLKQPYQYQFQTKLLPSPTLKIIHSPTPYLNFSPLTSFPLTKTPTQILSPTKTPTQKPSPTKILVSPTPKKRQINKEKLTALVKNPPKISCAQGGNCADLYNQPLIEGIGFATYYGNESATGYNVVADVIHNLKGISMDEARKFIEKNLMKDQSNLTPDEARKTGKVIAFGATRSCKDEWRIKYLFGVNNPKKPDPYFIGRMMVIDCAREEDWLGYLSTLTYSYLGWDRLSWIVDLSRNGFIQLPTGLTGERDNTGEGRPGVILIDESVIDKYLN